MAGLIDIGLSIFLLDGFPISNLSALMVDGFMKVVDC